MSASREIENNLGIALPEKYKSYLDSPPDIQNEYIYQFYFLIDPKQIIEDNRAYKMDIYDLSDIDNGTFLGSLKRFLFYGTKDKIIKHRKKHVKEWVEPGKFVIGSDGGEEMFFIYLNNPECPVFVYELETKESYKKYNSITEYFEYLKTITEEDT